MHCCVIGGSGFIGHHLVQLLIKDRQVTVIGRNDVPSRQLPSGVKYIAGDYGDKYFLKCVLDDVDEVINLAYSSVPKVSFDDPIIDILTNLPPTVNLFTTVLELNVKRLIIISSGGTIYGKTNKVISENHPTNPISPYGINKLAIEKYANLYRLMGLPVICLRPSNIYGPGQTPFIGQGFIATAIKSILNGEDVNVFGVSPVRDMLYVKDAVEAIVATLNGGIIGECYNVGSGVGINNLKVAKTLLDFAKSKGIKFNLNILPNRPFDVPSNVLDCSKIKNELGWIYKTTFEVGLKETWEYYVNAKTL